MQKENYEQLKNQKAKKIIIEIAPDEDGTNVSIQTENESDTITQYDASTILLIILKTLADSGLDARGMDTFISNLGEAAYSLYYKEGKYDVEEKQEGQEEETDK